MQIKTLVEKSSIDNDFTQSVKFSLGNTLVVDRENNEIRLFNIKEELQLSIKLTTEGLLVNVNAKELNISAAESLNLSSKKININATEQINIKTAGNFVQEVNKDFLSEVGGTNKLIAQVQKITATLGNVNIKANDDVRLDGERVKLNCD